MLPFSAVVGADEAKRALLLAAVDPAIGGVLLRGEKGSAKTTLARGLAALLPGRAPFVDLPVGATEDRVIGSLDVAAALTGGEVRLRPGLVASAHGGVLYVDEVNLLPDHLVDVLLDAAATGINRVEREGIAHSHPARFLLIGSMNPEEGELRPQFLDRFGLCVDVAAPSSAQERAVAVRRRLAADRAVPDPAWERAEAELAARLAVAVDAGPAALPDDLVEAVSALCVAAGAEGLRADLVICRAAAALARWEGRPAATPDDVRQVAALALAHRTRRNPLDPHGLDRAALDRALHDALDAGDEPRDGARGDGGEATGPAAPTGDESEPSSDADPRSVGDARPGRGGPVDADAAPVPPAPPPVLRLAAGPATRSGQGGRGSAGRVPGTRGRLVSDRPPGPGGPESVAVAATVRQAAARRAGAGGPAMTPADVREAVREQRAGQLVVVAVDASGSMGERRIEAAKAAVLGLLLDAYQRRDRVALVAFRGDRADVVLRPTGSVEVARARLAELPTGGRTPLAAGILAALDLATAATLTPLVVLITDGRATSAPAGSNPLDAAREAAALVRARGVSAVVVDAEEGPARLGLAAELATAMGGRYLTVPELTGGAVQAAVRGSLR